MHTLRETMCTHTHTHTHCGSPLDTETKDTHTHAHTNALPKNSQFMHPSDGLQQSDGPYTYSTILQHLADRQTVSQTVSQTAPYSLEAWYTSNQTLALCWWWDCRAAVWTGPTLTR